MWKYARLSGSWQSTCSLHACEFQAVTTCFVSNFFSSPHPLYTDDYIPQQLPQSHEERPLRYNSPAATSPSATHPESPMRIGGYLLKKGHNFKVYPNRIISSHSLSQRLCFLIIIFRPMSSLFSGMETSLLHVPRRPTGVP